MSKDADGATRYVLTRVVPLRAQLYLKLQQLQGMFDVRPPA